MTIFFTGCTHFDHANILKLANRPFASVEEMNEALVERWNAKVRPTDTVFHLGDVSWGGMSKWVPRLYGRKVLIRGNHDPQVDDIPRYMGFDQVHHYQEIGAAGTRFVLFHYPIDDWNGRWKGHIHLHCHTHSDQFRNPNMPPETAERFPPDIKCNRFNIGVDACDFAPVSIHEIINKAHH